MLSDLLVIELASVLAGPSAGQFLAESGAEVIKVENPKTNGDVTRSWKSDNENTKDVSAYFSCTNWGKKSLALDYSKPEGLLILYQLLEKADIVIASYKPGDAEKLKTSYEHLREINNKIIYASITGFGENDKRVGYDAIIQAESGFMSINGEIDGPPLKMPVALMDILTGHQLKEAILLAYIKKLKEGVGSKVEVSLIDTAISSLANQATNWLVANNIPTRQGSKHPNIAPYGEIFKTADDKWIILAIGNDRQFESLCDVLVIKCQSKFKSNRLRVKHRDELEKILSKGIELLNSKSLLDELNARNVPVGVIRNIPEALDTYPNTITSNNELRGIKNFTARSTDSTKDSHFLPPPKYGEHTLDILSEKLALKPSYIEKMKDKGIIHTP